MGRELKRKQAKIDRKNNKNINVKEEKVKTLRDYVLIVVLVLVILSSIYVLSGLFVTKELKWFNNDSKEESSNQNVANTILANEIFKQKENEYYVYFYDYTKSDDELSSNVKSKIYTSKIYYVDTNSALNKNYVSEETNKNAKKLEDLKVKSKTLIKIEDDNIVTYYEDKEILGLLK